MVKEKKVIEQKRKIYNFGNEWLYLTIAQRDFDADKLKWVGVIVILGSIKLFRVEITFKIG
jgi:hypothetical protein